MVARNQTETTSKKTGKLVSKEHYCNRPLEYIRKTNQFKAQKYKQYNKLRIALATADRDADDSKKRKQFAPSLTPSKRPKHAQTPSKADKLADKSSRLTT